MTRADGFYVFPQYWLKPVLEGIVGNRLKPYSIDELGGIFSSNSETGVQPGL